MSTQLDVITLRGLGATGIHGVLPEEWHRAQPFSVDLSLWVDTQRAAHTDDISDTVSYADIAQRVEDVITGPSVRLIETLGHRIAQAVMTDPRVRGVEVTVHKPEAPIQQHFSDVSVTIRRGEIGELPLVSVEEPPAQQPVASARGEAVPASGAPVQIAAANAVDAHPDSRAAAPVRSFALSEAPAASAESASPSLASRRVVLALGGNVGNVPVTLAQAIAQLVEHPGITVDEVSPLLRTRAVLRPGQEAQDDYWNAVVLAHTTLDAHELLAVTSALETALGRVRTERWGARTIDIDLIQVEGVRSDDEDLTLPHPRARERAFVLAPWVLADPDAVLEGRGRAADLLELTPDRDGIVDAVADWVDSPDSVVADSNAHILGEESLPASPVAQPLPRRTQVTVPPLEIPEVNHELGTRASRLDHLPEASRVGLHPDETGTDIVWQRLWERWAAPLPQGEFVHAPDTSSPSDQSEEDTWDTPMFSATVSAGQLRERATDAEEAALNADRTPEAAPAEEASSAGRTASRRKTRSTVSAPSASSAASTHEVNDASGDAEDARTQNASDTDASAQDAAEDSAEGSRRGLFATREQHAQHEQRAHHRSPRRSRGPRWLPLIPPDEADEREEGSAPRAEKTRPARGVDGATTARVDETPTSRRAGRADQPHALPAWDFSTDVRIVDDETAVESPADSASASPSRAAARRAVLEPDLSDSLLRGAASDDATQPRAEVQRRVTVRPTVTGQIPIVRERRSR